MRSFLLWGVLPLASAQCSKTGSPFQLGNAPSRAVCFTADGTSLAVLDPLSGSVPNGALCAVACGAGTSNASPLARNMQCTGSTWSYGQIPLAGLCQDLTCPDYYPPANSSSGACTGYVHGRVCNMTCDSGFSPNAFSQRVCWEGKWTGLPLQCTQLVCPDIPPPVDGNGENCTGKTEGQTCSWGCSTNAGGSSVRTCTNGQWDGQPFTCTPSQYCPVLTSPFGAEPVNCVHKVSNDVCTFKAMEGYNLVNATRTCQVPNWSGSPAVAIPTTCPTLMFPANAENFTTCGNSHGSVCIHECLPNYVSNNKGVWSCYNGVWYGSPLVCSPQSCSTLTSPDNAYPFSCDNYKEGQVCAFACKAGFNPTGHGARVCQGGEWTGYSFQCTASGNVWAASDFGQCYDTTTNQTCGVAGIKFRQVICYSGAIPTSSIPPGSCLSQTNAHDVANNASCIVPPCVTYSWQYGQWDPVCSADCGGGYQERTGVCMSSDGAAVEDAKCSVTTPAVRTQQCNTQPCVGNYFRTGPWSPCSEDCSYAGNIGKRTRYGQCVDIFGQLAAALSCTDLPTTQDCNTQLCGSYSWDACPWEPCTAQCNGGGVQAGLMAGQKQRVAFCLDVTGAPANRSNCLSYGLPTPTELEVGCNPAPCTTANWMTTPWSDCVGTGAVGTRTRTYHCHDMFGANAAPSVCAAVTAAPSTSEPCTPGACPTAAPTLVATTKPTPATSVNEASQLTIRILALFGCMNVLLFVHV